VNNIIHVLPRKQTEAFSLQERKRKNVAFKPFPYVVISIGDPGQKAADLSEDCWRKAVHRIEVTDLDHDYRNLGGGKAQVEEIRLFNQADAAGVLDFHEMWRGKAAFLIHCEAGISRSRGVAMALALIEGRRDLAQQQMDEGTPNPKVVWEILKQHKRRTNEVIPWPENHQEEHDTTCGHDAENLRYEGAISIGDIGTNEHPPNCGHCGAPGMKITVDTFARWRKEHATENTQDLAR